MPDFSKDGMMRVAVDAAVFTIVNDELHLLLIKRKYQPFKDSYALPGGFVKTAESLKDAAKRELIEETGVHDIHLHQIHAYGEPKRDPRGRIVSVAFLALIASRQELRASADASDARWFALDSLPKLAFDHEHIIKDALKQLRFEVQTSNIAFQILPVEFTLTQMQKLYESVLGKALDKRNFRKKVKELDLLAETGKQWQEGAHRPAMLYRFRERKHLPLQEKVNVFLS